MVLREIISPIFASWLPENFELALLHSILKPLVPRASSFAPLLPCCAISGTAGSGAASFHRCRGLQMA